MNPDERENLIWERISRALFSIRQRADGGLFTYRVMEQIRRLQRPLQELAWHRFLRWAYPILGLGAATLILAARPPAISAPQLMEASLFHQQLPDEDPLANVLEVFR